MQYFVLGMIVMGAAIGVLALALCRASAIAEEIERRLRDVDYDERG